MKKATWKKTSFAEKIVEIIRTSPSINEMREQLQDYHDNDIAQSLQFLNRAERNLLYSALDAEWLAEIISYLDDPAEYIDEIGIDKLAEILNEMDADDAVDLWENIDESVKVKLRPMIDDETKSAILLINSYDDSEVGSLITTNYICIKQNLTIRQAMHELVKQAGENDNIGTIYVVDDKNRFCGAIDLKDLIVARENVPLDSIISYAYPYLLDHEKISESIEKIKDYAEDSLPVLNKDRKIIGIITAQDVVEAVDDELGEDYAKLGGLTAGEDLEEPLRRSVAKRLPWLVILLGLGLVVSSVVGLFERVVTHLTVIICFQSLVLDMAGNVGTQSLAVTIRVLMDEDVSPRQKLALVGKEARVGLMNGLLLGLLSFGAIGLYLMAAKGAAAAFAFSVSFCTGTALLVSMLLSSIIGTTVPILFKRLGVDPAVASGPLITTVNDLVAVTAYYGLAWLLLIEVLHF